MKRRLRIGGVEKGRREEIYSISAEFLSDDFTERGVGLQNPPKLALELLICTFLFAYLLGVTPLVLFWNFSGQRA
jgi:hypothetical protein